MIYFEQFYKSMLTTEQELTYDSEIAIIGGEMSTYGYYRFAAATPQVRVADVEFNTAAVTACLKEAAANGALADRKLTELIAALRNLD